MTADLKHLIENRYRFCHSQKARCYGASVRKVHAITLTQKTHLFNAGLSKVME
jgi:hypothetical protein